MRSSLRRLAFALCLAAGVPFADAASSFRIDQLYSNLDGSVQYIQLRESAGRDGEQGIGGLKVRVTGSGVTREYTISHDLYRANTGGQAVVVSTGFGLPTCCMQQLVYLEDFSTELRWMSASFTADYGGLPERFLPVDGGTVELVGVDSMSYGALPTSGYQALDRSGQVVTASVVPFWVASFPYAIQVGVPLPALVLSTQVPAREYYHAGLDHYLLTANAQDIEAIESGRAPGWAMVGAPFPVESLSGSYLAFHEGPTTVTVATAPVCRYYLAPPQGDSHFLSASAAECATVGRDQPGALLESNASFYVYLAHPDGTCAEGLQPVYRLWNGKPAANHRYTPDEEVRSEMIARGWIAEGAGPLGVAFCAQPWVWWDY